MSGPRANLNRVVPSLRVSPADFRLRESEYHSVGEQQGQLRRPNGSTRLKRKQLRQLGYAMVSVPFWEWKELQGEQEQSEYLEGNFEFS